MNCSHFCFVLNGVQSIFAQSALAEDLAVFLEIFLWESWGFTNLSLSLCISVSLYLHAALPRIECSALESNDIKEPSCVTEDWTKPCL